MKKSLAILMAASFALTILPASAQSTATTNKKVATKAVKKTAKKAPVKKVDPDDIDADVTGSIVTEYGCAEGRHITVFRNEADPSNVALRWGNRIIRMKRVETASGAERLEHEKRGLVFIGIPAKSLLLDAKKGTQLANDCLSPEQIAASQVK